MKNQINKDYNDKKTCLYEVLTKATPAKLDESTIFFSHQKYLHLLAQSLFQFDKLCGLYEGNC